MRGLSELTAVVILLAITVMIGAALYGFYFSSQGSASQNAASDAYSVVNSAVATDQGGYYSSPEVSATVDSCTSSGGSLVCTLSLTNTGSGNAEVLANTCTISVGGVPTTGANSATSLTAGSSGVAFTCAVTGTEPLIGSSATGSIPLSDGSTVTWSGTWS